MSVDRYVIFMLLAIYENVDYRYRRFRYQLCLCVYIFNHLKNVNANWHGKIYASKDSKF